jgi:hypothetical protein
MNKHNIKSKTNYRQALEEKHINMKKVYNNNDMTQNRDNILEW